MTRYYRQWSNAPTTVSVQTKRRASTDVASTRVAWETPAAWTLYAGRCCTGPNARARTVTWATRRWDARRTRAAVYSAPATGRPRRHGAPWTRTAHRLGRVARWTVRVVTHATRYRANCPEPAWSATIGPGVLASTVSPSASWASCRARPPSASVGPMPTARRTSGARDKAGARARATVVPVVRAVRVRPTNGAWYSTTGPCACAPTTVRQPRPCASGTPVARSTRRASTLRASTRARTSRVPRTPRVAWTGTGPCANSVRPVTVPIQSRDVWKVNVQKNTTTRKRCCQYIYLSTSSFATDGGVEEVVLCVFVPRQTDDYGPVVTDFF